MILQALVKRYEEAGGAPQGWQERAANFALNISQEGEILDIVPLPSPDGKRNRQVFTLPKEPSGRTSGVNAAFLCDNCQYIFGLCDVTKAKKDGKVKERQKRAEECFEASKELHISMLSDVDSVSAKAVASFFTGWTKIDATMHPKLSPLLADGKSADEFYKAKFLFQVNGKYAHEDGAIVTELNERVSSESNHSALVMPCLVTGDEDAVARLHDPVILSGVSMGAAPFVSINSESFASYGKSAKDPAAQIGERAAFAYVTALNDLLRSENHHQRLGQDTIVYWAEGGGEAEAEVFTWAMQPSEGDSGKLASIMQLVSKGLKVDIDDFEPTRKFHILCISPNAGRISVRFFLTDSFGTILNNVFAHYQHLDIIAPSYDKTVILPPWMLLSETTVKTEGKPKGDVSKAQPLLGGQLLGSIIKGSPYPSTLYNSILMRVRAGEGVNRAKAAIVKAILIRNYKECEVTTVALNEDSNSRPYVLGRLFAVLEHLQKDAIGSSTIKSRYFSSASSNPGNVFPTLLKLSSHHAAKLDNPVYYEKLKTDLLGRLDDQNPFPTVFRLEEQGQFILGYYHQSQYFFTPKKDKQNKEEQ